jgi:hypothetical protein
VIVNDRGSIHENLPVADGRIDVASRTALFPTLDHPCPGVWPKIHTNQRSTLEASGLDGRRVSATKYAHEWSTAFSLASTLLLWCLESDCYNLQGSLGRPVNITRIVWVGPNKYRRPLLPTLVVAFALELVTWDRIMNGRNHF